MNTIVKTCDLPVTREKTVAETSFLCGFRGKGESSNPLTHVKPSGNQVSRGFLFVLTKMPDTLDSLCKPRIIGSEKDTIQLVDIGPHPGVQVRKMQVLLRCFNADMSKVQPQRFKISTAQDERSCKGVPEQVRF